MYVVESNLRRPRHCVSYLHQGTEHAFRLPELGTGTTDLVKVVIKVIVHHLPHKLNIKARLFYNFVLFIFLLFHHKIIYHGTEYFVMPYILRPVKVFFLRLTASERTIISLSSNNYFSYPPMCARHLRLRF
jgi:hypothetical protein